MEKKAQWFERIIMLLVATGFSLLAHTILQALVKEMHIVLFFVIALIFISATLAASGLHSSRVTPMCWIGIIAGHVYAYDQIKMRSVDMVTVQIEGVTIIALASVLVIAEEQIRSRAKQ